MEVPSDRDGDSTVVAVLFNLTGQNKFLLDDHGTLSIDHPADIKAYDIFGKEIVPGGEGFSIPFSNSPVYLLSNQLSVLDFYGKLQHARIEQITPVKMYALSLEEDVDQPQKLRVRIENMLAEPVEGTLFHEVEGKDEAGSTEFRLEAGELGEVSLDWKGTLEWNEDNVYPIKLSAKTRTSRSELYEVSEKFQFLNVAQMPERSIRVDGNIAEWREIEPLCANSALMLNEVDPTCCLLHPGAECCNSQESDKVKIKTRIAYDDNYIYVSAEILEKESSNLAGTKEFEDLEYIKGMSGGLRHPTTTGDCLQLTFGFRDRVPGRGRQMDDNWAWKGFYYDTDYQYLVYPSSEGDQLVQQWDESSPRRNGFQTEEVEEIHPVQGSMVQISRDEENETTIYELAIPRNEIPLFNEELEDFRFSYIYNNNEGASGGRLQYSNMMGVFDHWRNFGSFAPTWMQTTSCQTFVHIK